MRATRWRIYYDDGSTFAGAPEEAPGRGVIVIVQADAELGRILLCRWDFYCWHPDSGQWWGHDVFGLWDCLADPGWRRVVFGRTITTERFRELLDAADRDPRFAPRSGRPLLDRSR